MLMALAPAASAATPSYGFENGLPANWTTTGLWHVSNCRAYDGSYSLGYNKNACPTDFNVGYTAGDAAIASVHIPASLTAASFTFASWSQTEHSQGPSWPWPCGQYDVRYVDISTDGGNSWTPIWQECAEASWNVYQIDLTAFIGQTVSLRFHFDSQDGAYNSYEGWYVDDVEVLGSSGPILPAPELPTMALAGLGIIGIGGMFVLQRRK